MDHKAVDPCSSQCHSPLTICLMVYISNPIQSQLRLLHLTSIFIIVPRGVNTFSLHQWSIKQMSESSQESRVPKGTEGIYHSSYRGMISTKYINVGFCWSFDMLLQWSCNLVVIFYDIDINVKFIAYGIIALWLWLNYRWLTISNGNFTWYHSSTLFPLRKGQV